MELFYIILLVFFGLLFLVAELVLLPGVSVGALLALVSDGSAIYLAFRDFGTTGGAVTIAVIMTIGVYGLVAGIVKLDDLGLWLSNKASSAARALGAGILRAAPWLMKGLSIAGTAAMFLVGGGILVHGVPVLHHAVEATGTAAAQWPVGGLWAVLVPNLLNAVVGIVAGGLVLAGVTLVQRLRGKSTAQ